MAIMIEPQGRGRFGAQAQEALSTLQDLLDLRSSVSPPGFARNGTPIEPFSIITQTIFLRRASDLSNCERMLKTFYRDKMPATNFLFQPPCSGAALAIEAWAIAGQSVKIEHPAAHTLAVTYDGVRFVYCGGIRPAVSDAASKVHPQVRTALQNMRATLRSAGSCFEHVVRLWFYLGGVTAPEGHLQRYHELNRARTDFYRKNPFCGEFLNGHNGHPLYPASTGIGMRGRQLIASCLALETSRPDFRLVALDNPCQTPPCLYPPKYSPQSPKFARATAMLLGDYVTTWISGTASVVNSESCHPGDIEKQTEQTIDNIERLISPANFQAHGISGAGSSLDDLAKIRVYLKREGDFAKCKAICERRFRRIPAIYALADVCRPELLVEIEGVAFSRRKFPD